LIGRLAQGWRGIDGHDRILYLSTNLDSTPIIPRIIEVLQLRIDYSSTIITKIGDLLLRGDLAVSPQNCVVYESMITCTGR
jgi:hypothetical protein